MSFQTLSVSFSREPLKHIHTIFCVILMNGDLFFFVQAISYSLINFFN